MRREVRDISQRYGLHVDPDAYVENLPVGAQQRVEIIKLLYRHADILILDEPSSGVDIAGESLLCELLDALRAERGFTQVMVTHDLSLVTAHATDVICLNRRVMGQGPTQSTLNAAVLAATFGIHLGVADLHPLPGCAHDEHGQHRHDPRLERIQPGPRQVAAPASTSRPAASTSTTMPATASFTAISSSAPPPAASFHRADGPT